MTEDWQQRWRDGRTGWHEPDGNAGLRRHWPASAGDREVLVPLCGASPDLRWLAESGSRVTGVELSELAAARFFAEQELAFDIVERAGMPCYRAQALPLDIVCGDYFEFDDAGYNALYDRGSLIALPPAARPAYIGHTDRLLTADPLRLVITLEYPQDAVNGPPFAVLPEELLGYWPELREVSSCDDIDNAPPKFRQAGLQALIEKRWLSGD